MGWSLDLPCASRFLVRLGTFPLSFQRVGFKPSSGSERTPIDDAEKGWGGSIMIICPSLQLTDPTANSHLKPLENRMNPKKRPPDRLPVPSIFRGVNNLFHFYDGNPNLHCEPVFRSPNMYHPYAPPLR